MDSFSREVFGKNMKLKNSPTGMNDSFFINIVELKKDMTSLSNVFPQFHDRSHHFFSVLPTAEIIANKFQSKVVSDDCLR